MSHKIILVAETGSDITPALAKELGILLVSMPSRRCLRLL